MPSATMGESWKRGDRVVVRGEPGGAGTIDGEALVVAAASSRVRFWPVMFDDMSERMIEESALAPDRSRRRRAVGEVVRTIAAASGTVAEVVEDARGRPRYRVEVWVEEADLAANGPATWR